MPGEGFSAAEQGLGHSERVDRHLLRVAAEEGTRMSIPDHIPNTHLALAMGEVARDGGMDLHWATHMAIFSAYFAEERDIGDRGTLLAMARGIEGLDPSKVEAAWDDGSMDERLGGFRRVAVRLGVDATPAALVCNELLIGTRPYEVMQAAVDRCLLTPAGAGDGSGTDPPGE